MALNQVGLERLNTATTRKIGTSKNLIINGAMQVAQRGTSFTVSDAYTLDRYKFKIAGGGAATITQSTTSPDDFTYSYKVDVTTADTSVANTDHGVIMHMIEGYKFAPANFGSSAARACKLSFYVRSNKTGTYSVAFQNENQNRSLIQEYTISAADTWERKTITVLADTSGTWETGTGTGLKITWGLMGGSTYSTSDVGVYKSSNLFLSSNQVNLFDNTSNEWYMTGAQLEIGSTATDFEHKSFAEDLTLCHRYYYRLKPAGGAYFGSGFWYNSNSFICHIDFPVLMRANVTALEQSGTADHYKVINNATTSTCSSVPTFLGDPNPTSQSVNFNFNGSGTQGQGGLGRSGNAAAFLGFSAEL